MRIMRPQFFPWLFDDKDAWEKSLADPRYSYDLPIDNFMAIYQIDRKAPDGSPMPLPTFASPAMPVAQTPMVAMASPSSFVAMPAVAVAPQPPPKEEKQDGILSQDEIDALLSGI